MNFADKIIYDLIPENSKVLDLGCGDGSLLSNLKNKNCLIQGIEINEDLVKSCIKNGIPVVQDDIDEGFEAYKDKSFDFVILNYTLQATYEPLFVMEKAIRVGEKVIVSFPNFAHISIRAQLFFTGKMPKNKDLPYEWYNTPNIHLVSILDFTNFCKNNNFQIERKFFYNDKRLLADFCPNLFSPYGLFVIKEQ